MGHGGGMGWGGEVEQKVDRMGGGGGGSVRMGGGGGGGWR